MDTQPRTQCISVEESWIKRSVLIGGWFIMQIVSKYTIVLIS